MSTYTVDGYLAALKVREGRTILTEGSGDRKLLSRVVLEFELNGRPPADRTVIDTAELVRGQGEAVGNRALVELLHQRATAEGSALVALVDREYREFQLEQEVIDQLDGEHRVLAETLFWTNGHSAENYLFEEKYFLALVRLQFPEHVNAECLGLCSTSFPRVLGLSAAITLALHRLGLIERSKGLVRHSHWAQVGGEWQFDIDAFSGALATRGVDGALIGELRSVVETYSSKLCVSTANNLARLLNHGHLGWEFMWCGVAAAARANGLSARVVDEIAHGFQDVKMRVMLDLVSRDIVEGTRIVIPGLWAWLLGQV